MRVVGLGVLTAMVLATAAQAQTRDFCQATAHGPGLSSVSVDIGRGDVTPYSLRWEPIIGWNSPAIEFEPPKPGGPLAIRSIRLSVLEMPMAMRLSRQGTFEMRFRGQLWRKAWRANPEYRKGSRPEEYFTIDMKTDSPVGPAGAEPDGFVVFNREGRRIFRFEFTTPPDAELRPLVEKGLAMGLESARTGQGCYDPTDTDVESVMTSAR